MLLLLSLSLSLSSLSFSLSAVIFFLALGSKRKFNEMAESRGEKEDKIEEWSLRDVIFVDHVTTLNMGVVVKLDGNYVAVHYPLDGEELSQVDIGKCRLLRKDEMVVSVWL